MPEQENAILENLQKAQSQLIRHKQIREIKQYFQSPGTIMLSELNKANTLSPIDIAADRLGFPRLTWEERKSLWRTIR